MTKPFLKIIVLSLELPKLLFDMLELMWIAEILIIEMKILIVINHT